MKTDNFDKIIRGKNINFLIGSGASVPMYPSLSFGKGYPTFEEVASDINLSDDSKKFLYIYYYLRWIKKMGEPSDKFKSRISKSNKYASVFYNYKRLIKIFYEFLQAESNESPKRINVFTTNYDLLFERAFDDFLVYNPLIYFNDGSRGVFTKYINNKNFYLNVTHSGYNDNYKREVPTVNLLKLHGSVSWKLHDDRIIVDEYNEVIREISNTVKELGIKSKQVKDIIDTSKNENTHLFVENLNNNVQNLKLNDKDLKKFYYVYSKLPIINPNKYKFFKTVSEQHYYQLIRSFSYELEKKQSILIVFGFSFADEHLKDIFERSLLNPELQVVIISYSKESQDSIKNMFEGYKNIFFLPDDFDGTKGDFNYLLSLLGDCDGE